MTLGRRWGNRSEATEGRSRCDICGVEWLRAELERNEDGHLVCPDDRGTGISELQKRNARGGVEWARRLASSRGMDAWHPGLTDAAQDPAVTFAPFGVLLDLDPSTLALADGASVGPVAAGAATLSTPASPPGFVPPTYVARDSILKVPVLRFGANAWLNSSEAQFSRSLPVHHWFLFRQSHTASFGQIYGDTANFARVAWAQTVGVRVLNPSSGPIAFGRKVDDWSRAYAKVSATGDSFVKVGRQQVSGVAGTNSAITRINIWANFASGTSAWFLRRWVMIASEPDANALQAADDWVQQTFQGRIIT